MTEKSFEEMFPSLKGKRLFNFEIIKSPMNGKLWLRCNDEYGEIFEIKQIEELIRVSEIQQHCLDKQKTRDKLDKLESGIFDDGTIKKEIDKIKEELGL